jgi:hypothetical protein
LLFFFEVAFLVTFLVIDAIALRAPDDMVENLAESLGMCSDGPGSAPIEIPKRGPFLEKEQEREREMWRGALAVWEEESRSC